MKKILSMILLLTLCLSVFALVSCGDEEEPPKVEGITEEKWEEITSKPKFVNYTLLQKAVMNVPGEGEYEQVANIKIIEGKVEVTIAIDGNPTVLTYEGAEAEAQRKSYEDVFLALIDKFENFTYDKETKTYKNPEAITANISMDMGTVGTLTATLVMTNGVVSFDADGNIAKITCALSQTTTVQGQSTTITTDSMTWELSNYGTTVIETAAE